MTDHVVLVIGEIGDWSADTVADTVTKAGRRVFRLTTYDFPQRMQLAATFDGRWSGTITTSESRLCLDTVTGVYYRRPRTFDLPAAMSGPELRFARAQAPVGLGGILASLPARWINHPSVLADAEYKPRQLAAAAEAGLRTPATLITNDPQAVRSFADNVGHLVVKPLAEASVAEAGALSVAYTRQMTTDDYRDLSGVETTAHLFQQWIEPRYAVRLTAVGHRLFPVAIHASSQAARVDWRSDYDHHTYELVRCPEPVTAGIERYLNRFGLVFGAFDFIVSDGGEWYFLECNPAGQWGWLADGCDLPVADAIAAELTGAT